jgi:hypothetical protein
MTGLKQEAKPRRARIAPPRHWSDALTMSPADSALDPEQMATARRLLAPAAAREPVWPVLCAAGFAAATALMLATAMILAPPTVTTHMSRDLSGRPSS